MTGEGENKREIKLTPPPRVRKVEPIAHCPRAGKEAESPRRSLRWITVATFVVLLGVAFGVFFYLPHWVETRGTAVPAGDQPVEPPPPQEVTPVAPSAPLETLREQAVLKQRADESREHAARQLKALEAKGVSTWGGEAYRTATAFIAEGDGYRSDRDFASATSAYQESSQQLESLRRLAKQVMNDALAQGKKALSAGDAAAATRAFRLAQAIEPDNSSVSTGLKRAGVLNEVLRLLASGAELERRGDLERAAKTYRQAASLDPLSREAQQALARLDTRFTDEAFKRAMSDGVAALGRKDYQAAREAFERAHAIKPGPDVADGLAQAEEGARLEKIADHREKALNLEEKEEWRSAAIEYQSVLDLDATIRFAQEGKARCEERAELDERLRFHIDNAYRLSDEEVLREASNLLRTASSIEPAGPKLSEQISTLEDAVAKASTPVRVRLVSDDLTDVVIYKIGRLGTFESRELDIRPGRYTVVGTRRGYRDVRLELVIVAGEEPEALVVRCEEKL
jgi:tetratricopeptide (TPR) repeat protein